MSDGSSLPSGWAIASLDELTELSPSVDLGGKGDDDAVHFVPMAAVAENFERVDVSSVRPLAEVRKGYTAFAAGDVLLAKITPCMENGKGGLVPALPNRVAFGSTEFHVLRASGAIANSWLAWFLSQSAFRKLARANMTGTAGQMRVPAKWLRAVEFPVPPQAEQARIVTKLEELLCDLDAGVAELKAAQKKLAQYRQSLLKAAVEGALTAEWRAKHPPAETGAQLLQRILAERRARWEAKQLAKFKEQGKAPPQGWQKKYPEPVAPDSTGLPALPQGWVWASVDQLSPDDLANGRSVPTAEIGARVLRLTAIKAGTVDLREHKLGNWSEEEAAPFAVNEGDLLIVRGNGSLGLVGRAGLVGAVEDQIAYPDTMIRLRLVESVVSPAWIVLVWDSHVVRTHLERRARTSAGIYKIAQPDIVSAAVPVPCRAEQDMVREAVGQQLEQMAATQLALETALRQSAAQRQNILRAAFAGQLVPQDPADEPASVLLARVRAERANRAVVTKPRRRATTGIAR